LVQTDTSLFFFLSLTYLDKTPSPATMDRIKARYPLNESRKKVIKRYEKQAPGELAHIDITKVPKDIRALLKSKNFIPQLSVMIVPE